MMMQELHQAAAYIFWLLRKVYGRAEVHTPRVPIRPSTTDKKKELAPEGVIFGSFRPGLPMMQIPRQLFIRNKAIIHMELT